MAHYTLGQAAKRAGVAKSTITRAIQNGDISKRERVGNSYRIDPAELQRWIDSRPAKQSIEQGAERTDTPTERLLREMLDEMRQRAERAEARADREADHWRDLFKQQADQLAAQTRRIEDLTTKEQAQRPASWWDRLTGKSKAA